MTLAITVVVSAAAQTQIAPEDMPDAGNFNFPGDTVVLPLTDGGHPRVTVDFGDGQRYQFIVDTGASVNIIDSAIAEELGFEVSGEMEIGAPGGAQIPGKIIRVESVRVGDATITDAEFVTMDINEFSQGFRFSF